METHFGKFATTLQEIPTSSALRDSLEEEVLRRTAAFASFPTERNELPVAQEELVSSIQAEQMNNECSNEGVKCRNTHEAIEAEYSATTERAGVLSAGFLAEKPELAYQTFQKPHDSEWRKTNFPLAENEYGLQGLSCLHPQTASPRSRPKSEDKSANMFLIKSQTKSGAKMFGKRVNRLNRILTLDPFSTERDREERFMTARGENRTKTETELPCESHWVFSPRSLRTVPKAEIQLKLTNGTLRNTSDRPQGQELGCSRTERVLSGVSKQKEIRKCPQIPKRVKIEIKHPSKPQSEDYSSSLKFLKPKAHKIVLPLIPDGYSNTQSSQLMQTENFGSQPITSRRMTPKTILHRFGSFFGSTSNKRHNLPHLSDDSQTSSQTELGKAFSMKVVPQSCKSLRDSSKPILFHNHSPSVNSINDTMSTANASKLSGERSSAGSFKGTLSGSLNDNTVNSTRARDRQKSGSMSRGQVKMLDKLFNFGL